jgi:hypothetical protein
MFRQTYRLKAAQSQYGCYMELIQMMSETALLRVACKQVLGELSECYYTACE